MQTSVTEHMTVHVSRCLNGRGSTGFCRRCLDSCPRNAIDITDKGIHFDSARCTECALCARDCPTEVFSHNAFTPIDLITLVKGQKELGLYCQACDSGQMKADCLPVPCHGLLDDRLLVGLRAMGVEQLNLHGLDKCSNCQSRAGATRLAQTLKRTPTAIKAHFPSLYGVSETGNIFAVTSDENKTAPSVPESPTGRRRFLEGTVNVIAYAALSTLPVKLMQDQDSENGLIASDQHECMVKHVPQSHQLARLNLQAGEISTGDSVDAQAWFHEVRDHGSCDACGICSLSCPTGALLVKDSKQMLRLDHQPATCIGCGLCISLCPQQALQLLAVHDEATILNDATHTLFECEKHTCSSCSASFTHLDSATHLCRSCENEKNIRSQWLGDAG